MLRGSGTGKRQRRAEDGANSLVKQHGNGRRTCQLRRTTPSTPFNFPGGPVTAPEQMRCSTTGGARKGLH